MRIMLCLLLSVIGLGAQQAPVPSDFYILRDFAWDPVPGAVSYRVHVKRINNADAFVITTAATRVAVSNLTYDVIYLLSVQALHQNGQWSNESTNYVWPHTREEYLVITNWSANSLTGSRTNLGAPLRFTNSPNRFVGVEGWRGNNIDGHVFPQ